MLEKKPFDEKVDIATPKQKDHNKNDAIEKPHWQTASLKNQFQKCSTNPKKLSSFHQWLISFLLGKTTSFFGAHFIHSSNKKPQPKLAIVATKSKCG